MIDSLSLAVHAFARSVLRSFSVDDTLLHWEVNLSTRFRGPLFSVKMSPVRLKNIYLVINTGH